MNGRQKNATNAKYGESKKTRFMMAIVPHVTSGSGFRKFQADGFLFDRVYFHVPSVSLQRCQQLGLTVWIGRVTSELHRKNLEGSGCDLIEVLTRHL